jgi:Flp pilus assembly protein TadD
LILPILKKNSDPGFPDALAAYISVPSAGWMDWANRAGVLDELGEGAAAADASAHALALNPTHPAVLNNHCYILANGGKAAEALPYCEKAIEAAPNEPSIHHSYATALALAGKCEEGDAELTIARRLDPSSATYKKPIACKAS